MKVEEHRIELTRQEAWEMFGVDIGSGKCVVSHEFYQDYVNQLANLCAVKTRDITEDEKDEWNFLLRSINREIPHTAQGRIRTRDITEEEKAEWQKWDEYLANLDYEAARKRVELFDRDDYEPHPEWQPYMQSDAWGIFRPYKYPDRWSGK